MPEPKQWIKNWLSNRRAQFESNYNERRLKINEGLENFNNRIKITNARLDAEDSPARRAKPYSQEYFIPEYRPQYLTDMMNNLETVKEYFPKSYQDPGGDIIKQAYSSAAISQRKSEGTLFTPEQHTYLLNKKQELVNRNKEGKISRDEMRDVFNQERNEIIEQNISVPFWQAKNQIGWLGQYFPSSHSIVYNQANPSVRVHELTHSLSLQPRQVEVKVQSDTRWGKPQTTAIKSRLQVKPNASTQTYGKSMSYWDDPDEVYSRLMQIRHDAGLTPDKIVGKEDLKGIRRKVKDSPQLNELFMDRYTDESLLKMFNEVASLGTPNTQNNIFYSKKGTKLIKRKKYLS